MRVLLVLFVIVVFAFGGGRSLLRYLYLYNLYRLRRHLYRCHSQRYTEICGHLGGEPALFDEEPDNREAAFIYETTDNFSDPCLARLRNRIRRQRVYEKIALVLVVAWGVLVVLW